MASRRTQDPEEPLFRPRPDATLEGRENQLIAAAVDLAERQILEGTVSAQVHTHFLKLGSSREKIEQMKLKLENEYLEAKAEDLRNRASAEALYKDAIEAFRSYGGHGSGQPAEAPNYDD